MSTQTVTITVEDQDTDPVPSASVTLLQNGHVVCSGVTSSLGVVAFLLVEDGAYIVQVEGRRFSFTPETLTVADTGIAQAFTVSGDLLPMALPTLPTLCRVFGYIARGFTSPPEVVITPADLASLEGVGTGFTDLNMKLSTQGSRSVVADADGYWEVDLPVGGRFKVEILHENFSRTFEVPNLTSKNLSDTKEILLPSPFPSLLPY